MAEDKEIFKEFVNVMGKLIKSDVDPCEDFFKYATGNCSDEFECSPPYGLSATAETILKNEDITLSSFVKARDFYTSCKNETNFKELLQKSGLYESFGGWPAYESEWNGENFDWINVAAQLATLGMQTIISHNNEFDKSIKHVKTAAKKPKDEDKAEEILKLLGVSDDLLPDVLKDIHFIIEKIKAVPPMKFPRRNCVRIESKIKFKALDKEDQFNFKKYFEIYFGKPANDSDVLWLQNKEYLDNFLKVFINSDLKQIANYIFWIAGKQFLKGDISSKLTIEFFSPSLIAAIFTVYYTEDDYAKNMYILNTFVKNFEMIKNKYNSYGPEQVELYPKEVENFLKIKNLYFQQKNVDEDYANLEIDPKDFLQNIKNLQEHYPTKSHSFCASSDSQDQCDYHNFRQILSVIVFNHNKPMLHHFLGNGLRSWRNINYSCHNDIENENSQKYPNTVLEEQMKENDIENCYSTLPLTKAYGVSLKRIFADYKEWLNENPEVAVYQEEILKPLGLDNEKAFFVAYAQTFAQKPIESRWPSVMCLWNLKEFSDVFKCEVGCKMNKTGKFLF